MPSESDEPAPLKLTASGAVPEVADGVMTAVGATFGGGAVTVMDRVVVPVAPWLSVTVRRAVYEPAVV